MWCRYVCPICTMQRLLIPCYVVELHEGIWSGLWHTSEGFLPKHQPAIELADCWGIQFICKDCWQGYVCIPLSLLWQYSCMGRCVVLWRMIVNLVHILRTLFLVSKLPIAFFFYGCHVSLKAKCKGIYWQCSAMKDKIVSPEVMSGFPFQVAHFSLFAI